MYVRQYVYIQIRSFIHLRFHLPHCGVCVANKAIPGMMQSADPWKRAELFEARLFWITIGTTETTKYLEVVCQGMIWSTWLVYWMFFLFIVCMFASFDIKIDVVILCETTFESNVPVLWPTCSYPGWEEEEYEDTCLIVFGKMFWSEKGIKVGDNLCLMDA